MKRKINMAEILILLWIVVVLTFSAGATVGFITGRFVGVHHAMESREEAEAFIKETIRETEDK